MYGVFRALVPEKERRWKLRIDGVRQRYWYNTGRKQEVVMRGRFEFEGTGRDLRRAVELVIREFLVPRKQFVIVRAKEFLRHPKKYSRTGMWIERDVES